MIIRFTAVFLAFVLQNVPLQITVTGRVSNPSGAAVAGATVRLVPSGAATSTDADGRYAVSGPVAAEVAPSLVVSARGFIDATTALTIREGRAIVDVVLQSNPGFREEIAVTARSAAATGAPTSVALGAAEVRSVAGAADNVFRVLQTLPGVAATDDFGSRLSVRGGGPDQNLTVMDGVEIHNPYRLFGLTSAFNPETVDRFELTAGGFSARYGDRLSSILVVDNRAGTQSERFAGSAAISVTDANVVFEGRIPRGSWLVTGRRTYYDVFAERITDADLPSFTDLQGKAAWDLGRGRQLSLFVLTSRESTDAKFEDDSDERFSLGNTSRNDVAAATFSSLIGSRVTTTTVVSYYRYADDLDVAASFYSSTSGTNSPEGPVERTQFAFRRGLGVRDLALRQDVTFALRPGQTVSGGLEVHALDTDWTWRIVGDRNDSAANGSAVIGGTGLPDVLDSSRQNSRISAWVEHDARLASRLRLAGGVRLDHGGLAGETRVSPRLRATVDVSRRSRIRLAGGLFTQSPGYEKLLQSDYFVDLSDTATAGLESERSVHGLAAFEHDLGTAFTARVETYYKSFGSLIVGDLETESETAARIAPYRFPDDLASSVPIAPQITTRPVNGSSGEAYGFDVYLEKRARRAGDRLSGWASYSWGRAVQHAYDTSHPFDYDRRHALSLVSSMRLSRRLELGATLRVASGFPYTRPVGVRVAGRETRFGTGTIVIPAVEPASGLYVYTLDNGGVDNLNQARLPMFARLDLRLTYRNSSSSRWMFYVELINALDRDNAGNLTPELAYDPTSDRPAIIYIPDESLPRLPSFGVRVRF